MTINITVPAKQESYDLKPNITVIGVGGAGGNAVNNMIHSGLEGVDFLVANSDAQALANSKAERRIQLGIGVTRGLGAGSNPDIGRAAAEESMAEITENLEDCNMVFVAAGLGGGTGTGAGPIIARIAREHGILTVGVVTKPFHFEGAKRMRIAEAGLEELQQFVDTLLIIPNQNLFRVANEKTTFADAFKMADDVLYSGVRGVTDLMVMPGLINLDFADIRSIMGEMGKAMMGTGEAEGEKRAVEAAEMAIANPLLDDISMSGAKGVLINVTAGEDVTLFEVDEAANRIRDEVDADANIIFGSTFDAALQGQMRVSVVATGIEAAAGARAEPLHELPVRAEKPATIAAAAEPSVALIAATPIAGLDEDLEATVGNDLVFADNEAEVELETAEPQAEESAPPAEAPEGEAAEADEAAEAVEPVESMSPKPLPSADDSFIPAPPTDARTGRPEKVSADPFVAADLLNTGKEQPAKQSRMKDGFNLFKLVTGIGHDPQPASGDAAEPGEVAAPAADESVDPVPEAAAEEPAGLLGPVTPDDRIAGAEEEEDLLDIPAFLRRQAN